LLKHFQLLKHPERPTPAVTPNCRPCDHQLGVLPVQVRYGVGIRVLGWVLLKRSFF
jgi:hypothetical protein